jgi:hypothetical protein
VVVTGTRGRIRLHPPIYKPEGLTIALRNLPGAAAKPRPEWQRRLGRLPLLAPIKKAASSHRERTRAFPVRGNGMNYEAEEVMRCLRAGRPESADMPLHESLAIMRTLDRIRAPWGLRYPGED